MALILILDKRRYRQGSLSLKRGDDWVVDAKVIDRVGSVDTQYDLSNIVPPITGWFPGNVTGSVQILDAPAGDLRLSLPASGSINTELVEGSSMFITAVGVSGLFTVETPDFPLAIADRGFEM